MRPSAARAIPFDVRLVVATNRDLETAIAEDLPRGSHFRVNVLHVELPPLRARRRRAAARSTSCGSSPRRPGVRRHLVAAAERLLARLAGQRARADEQRRARGRAGASTIARGRRPAEDPQTSRDATCSSPATTRPIWCRSRSSGGAYILRVLQAVSNNKRLAARVARRRPQDAVPQARTLRRPRRLTSPASPTRGWNPADVFHPTRGAAFRPTGRNGAAAGHRRPSASA